MAINNPEKIGRYQIIERVGRGGMGVLYRGIDPVLDREVAIKLMLMDFSEDEEQMRPRFYREARAAAKLQHRNIVTVFEFAEEGTTPYIVMEFLRGTSLADRMKSPLPLTVDDKLNIIAQLCSALHYAHEEGVVHRDVKPANIFLLPDGTVKLLDFGIAKVTTSTLTQKGDVLGSASYMAPEQITGSDDVDGRSDMFSAGVVLYELLAGRKPFEAEVPTAIIMKILHEPPPSLADAVPGLPTALVAAVNRALAKTPGERFATVGEFAKELEWIRKTLQASGEGAEVLEETRFASGTEIRKFQKELGNNAPVPDAATEPKRGKPWLVPVAIGAVVVAAVGGALMFGRQSAQESRDAVATTRPSTPAAEAVAASAGPVGAGALGTPAPGAVASRSSATTAGATGKRGQVAAPSAGTIAAGEGRDGKPATAATKAAATVSVTISSTYPVQVLNGTRSIAEFGETHQLNVAEGSTLHVKAEQYLLDAVIRVEARPIEYQAPAIGYLTVLTKYETCSVRIGTKDLGYPPITKLALASGQHRVDIACENGQNPPGQLVTIAPNATATARIY